MPRSHLARPAVLPAVLKPVLEHRLGSTIVQAQWQSREGSCEVFTLHTAHGPFTVKVSTAGEPGLFFSAAQDIEQQRQAGHPTPAVLAYQDAPFGGLGAPGQAAPAFLLLSDIAKI